MFNLKEKNVRRALLDYVLTPGQLSFGFLVIRIKSPNFYYTFYILDVEMSDGRC